MSEKVESKPSKPATPPPPKAPPLPPPDKKPHFVTKERETPKAPVHPPEKTK